MAMRLLVALLVVSLLGCQSSRDTTPLPEVPCGEDGACPAGTECDSCVAPQGCEGIEGEDERCDECRAVCLDACGGCPAGRTCNPCPPDPECPECDVCGEPVCR